MRDVADNATATGWKLTLKRGILSGAGVSVSGLGAWARLSGNQTFTMKTIDRSTKYQQLKNTYTIGGGIFALFSWLGIGVNAQTHREEITGAIEEIVQEASTQGSIHYDLFVTGIFPNVQVDASGYIFALQITDSQGNTTNAVSDGNPPVDIGGQDQNGNKVPSQDNGSTITIT